MSATESAELLDLTEQFQQRYHFLYVTSGDRGESQWLFTTKLNCLWHTMYFAKWLSPKASWTFGFEDFIGRLKASGRACVHGTAMHKVPTKLVRNYMIVMHLMFSEKAWHQRVHGLCCFCFIALIYIYIYIHIYIYTYRYAYI